jgi:hypothetical protein
MSDFIHDGISGRQLALIDNDELSAGLKFDRHQPLWVMVETPQPRSL